eukprot:scaffold12056_cov146-Isochrysis_galbana.AAC.3
MVAGTVPNLENKLFVGGACVARGQSLLGCLLRLATSRSRVLAAHSGLPWYAQDARRRVEKRS